MSTFFERLIQETRHEQLTLVNIPIIQDALNGQVSRSQYIAFLTQAYHHVKHTVPLLMACGSRLDSAKNWLKKAIIEYIEEEYGHEEWILNDIQAAGGNAQAAALSRPSIQTQAMVAFAYHQIDRCNPVGFFGMVHVLEGTSTALATQAAEKIRVNLGLPKHAFTYLDSHGTLDLEHVKFFESLMNQLTNQEDQQAVIDTARAMFHLYGEIFRVLPCDQHELHPKEPT
jgi:pyrroloquinoline quinone (PQQ) biosynthesis protein C